MKLNKRAMTLFELLAVIVILGIVAAIAYPTVNSLIKSSKENTFRQQANTFISAALAQANSDVISNGQLSNSIYTVDNVAADLPANFTTTYAGSWVQFGFDNNNAVVVTGLYFVDANFVINTSTLSSNTVTSSVPVYASTASITTTESSVNTTITSTTTTTTS